MKVAKPLKCTMPNKINIPRIFFMYNCILLLCFEIRFDNIYIRSFKYLSFQNLAFIIKKAQPSQFVSLPFLYESPLPCYNRRDSGHPVRTLTDVLWFFFLVSILYHLWRRAYLLHLHQGRVLYFHGLQSEGHNTLYITALGKLNEFLCRKIGII